MNMNHLDLRDFNHRFSMTAVSVAYNLGRKRFVRHVCQGGPLLPGLTALEALLEWEKRKVKFRHVMTASQWVRNFTTSYEATRLRTGQ